MLVPVLVFVLAGSCPCSFAGLVRVGIGCAGEIAVSTDKLMPHEKLIAYRLAIKLLGEVQALDVADARMRDQLLRAAKSVCLNIAEGAGRFSVADKRRVYAIARGECCETAAAIDVVRQARECDPDNGRIARDTAGRVYALLTGLIRRYDFETAGSKTSHVNEHEHDSGHENEHEHEHGLDNEHEHDPGLDNGHGHEHGS